MSLFHKVIGVVIALLGFLACNDDGQQNAVKDEGFYKTTQSFSRMMSKLEKNHGIKSTDPTLRSNIRKSIESSFAIVCPDVVGTGVFTSSEGAFVTAAHVISRDRSDCHILTNELTDTGDFTSKKVQALMLVDQAKQTHHTWDIAVGRISGFKNKNYLSISKNHTAKKVIAIGYPSYTLRNGTNNKISESDARDAINEECKVLIDYYQKLYTLFPGNKEISSRAETLRLLCKLRDSRRKRFATPYDMAPKGREAPAFLSVGNLSYQNSKLIVASPDVHNGMSGGPLVDLNTGELLGILSYSALHKNFAKLEKILYFGGAVWQKISEPRLKKLSGLQQSRSYEEACVCDWSIESSDRQVLSTIWIGRKRTKNQCDDMSGFERGLKKAELTSWLSNCRLDQVGGYQKLDETKGGDLVVLGANRDALVIPSNLEAYDSMRPELGFNDPNEFPCIKESKVNVILSRPESLDSPFSHQRRHMEEGSGCDGYGGDFYKITVNKKELNIFVQYNVEGRLDLSEIADTLEKMPPSRLKNLTQISILHRSFKGEAFARYLSKMRWNSSRSLYMIDESVLQNRSDWLLVMDNLWMTASEN